MKHLAIALLLLDGVAQAAPKQKIAALILKSGNVEQDLADNLTDVLIARLARHRDFEIAGKEELKAKLGVDERAAAECMDNAVCLGRAGTELGVTRTIVGTLGRRGNDYLYNLTLFNLETGKIENRIFELVAGGKVDALIAAVESTVDKLLEPKVEPGAVRVVSETRGALVYLDEAFIGSSPVRRDGIEPGVHALRVEKEGHLGWSKEVEVPAGSTLQIKVPLTALPERRQWPGHLAIGLVVVAAVAAVPGAVLLILSANAPADSTVTRAEALSSASTRFLEGRAGYSLLAAAGALGITAGGIALGYRRDIFGEPSRPTAKPRASLAVAPTLGGAQAALTVRW